MRTHRLYDSARRISRSHRVKGARPVYTGWAASIDVVAVTRYSMFGRKRLMQRQIAEPRFISQKQCRLLNWCNNLMVKFKSMIRYWHRHLRISLSTEALIGDIAVHWCLIVDFVMVQFHCILFSVMYEPPATAQITTPSSLYNNT